MSTSFLIPTSRLTENFDLKNCSKINPKFNAVQNSIFCMGFMIKWFRFHSWFGFAVTAGIWIFLIIQVIKSRNSLDENDAFNLVEDVTIQELKEVMFCKILQGFARFCSRPLHNPAKSVSCSVMQVCKIEKDYTRRYLIKTARYFMKV